MSKFYFLVFFLISKICNMKVYWFYQQYLPKNNKQKKFKNNAGRFLEVSENNRRNMTVLTTINWKWQNGIWHINYFNSVLVIFLRLFINLGVHSNQHSTRDRSLLSPIRGSRNSVVKPGCFSQLSYRTSWPQKNVFWLTITFIETKFSE